LEGWVGMDEWLTSSAASVEMDRLSPRSICANHQHTHARMHARSAPMIHTTHPLCVWPLLWPPYFLLAVQPHKHTCMPVSTRALLKMEVEPKELVCAVPLVVPAPAGAGLLPPAEFGGLCERDRLRMAFRSSPGSLPSSRVT
jgi:hypothetical protein